MVNRDKDFERIVIENKRRIYTVCYMFSKDKDEVADLFQEVLICVITILMYKGKSFDRILVMIYR